MSNLFVHLRPLAAGVLALGLMSSAAAAQVSTSGPDMALGSPTAPVTVVEYASVGCPHCANWGTEVFPAFKAKYIDTGKVRFVLREMLNGDSQLAAAGFLLARCVAPAKYFQVVDSLYANYQKIEAEGPHGPLLAIARQAGLTEKQFDACESNPTALAALQERAGRTSFGTPMFIIGGRLLENEQSMADIDAAIASARH